MCNETLHIYLSIYIYIKRKSNFTKYPRGWQY